MDAVWIQILNAGNNFSWFGDIVLLEGYNSESLIARIWVQEADSITGGSEAVRVLSEACSHMIVLFVTGRCAVVVPESGGASGEGNGSAKHFLLLICLYFF